MKLNSLDVNIAIRVTSLIVSYVFNYGYRSLLVAEDSPFLKNHTTPRNEIQMQLEHTVRQQQEWMDHLLAAGQEEEALHEQKIQDLPPKLKSPPSRRNVLKLRGGYRSSSISRRRCCVPEMYIPVWCDLQYCAPMQTLNELEVLLTTREEAKRKEYECQELKVLLTTREEEAKKKEYEHMQEKEAFTQEILALREDSVRHEREEEREGSPHGSTDGLVKEVTETVMKAR
ncbi:hypothetical protein EMCRGX_G015934 [Ephydatia muelleri]